MSRRLASAALAFAVFSTMPQAATIDDYTPGSMTYANVTIPFRLFEPTVVSGQRYPLVLTLHGVGESGSDNSSQLSNGTINWSGDAHQAARPSYVLSPQCPSNYNWATGGWSSGVYLRGSITPPLGVVMRIIDSLITVLPIDTNRLYVTGLSMGGMGTWDLIMRYGARFAAAVPVCGAVDTTKLPLVGNLPIWSYHGSDDDIVPPLGDRVAVRKLAGLGRTVHFPRCGIPAPTPCADMTPAALLAALPTAKTLYTEIAGGGHFAWDVAYVDTMMFRWMFLQTKQGVTPVTGERRVSVQATAGDGAPVEYFTLAGTRIGTSAAATRRGFVIAREGGVAVGTPFLTVK